jgi:hypothetical protein
VRRRSLFPLIGHSLLWGIFGCAFVAGAAPRVWEAIGQRHFGPILPYHTTNSYMVGLLKVQDGSERLSKVFAVLSREKPVAVVLPAENEHAIFLGYLVSYFAWPREVRSVPVTRANSAEQLQSVEDSAPGAIFFCGIEPPADRQPVVRLGANLLMTLPSATTAAIR